MTSSPFTFGSSTICFDRLVSIEVPAYTNQEKHALTVLFFCFFGQIIPADNPSLMELPGFFRLLTIFALYTFIKEKVRVP